MRMRVPFGAGLGWSGTNSASEPVREPYYAPRDESEASGGLGYAARRTEGWFETNPYRGGWPEWVCGFVVGW